MNHPLFLILVVAALTGCAGHPALEHPRYAPTIVPAVVNESPATRGSSLYSTATEVMLFEDVKASRVGRYCQRAPGRANQRVKKQ